MSRYYQAKEKCKDSIQYNIMISGLTHSITKQESFKAPFDAPMEAPNSIFGRFFREKYLLAVARSMEDSFLGNLDHRAFVERKQSLGITHSCSLLETKS